MALDDMEAIERAWKEGANKMIEYNDNNPSLGTPLADRKIYGPFSNCSAAEREQLKNDMKLRVKSKTKNTKKWRVKIKTKNSQKWRVKIKTKK
jgi:hypothetical protein